MDYLQQIMAAVIEGDEEKSVDMTNAALEDGIAPLDILNQGLIKGIEEVGRLYQEGEYYLPELLVGARALKDAMKIVKPLIVESGQKCSIGEIVIGSVLGDLHDIGKNIVAIMLEGAGFTVYDLGADVKIDEFCTAVEKYKPDILAMSSLISSTMMNMEKIIKALEERGLRSQVKVIVGGAPVNDKFCQRIGGDGYAEDANRAVLLCKQIISA